MLDVFFIVRPSENLIFLHMYCFLMIPNLLLLSHSRTLSRILCRRMEVCVSWPQFSTWIKICKLSQYYFLRKPLCHFGGCIACPSSLRQCVEGSIIIPAGSLICARTQGSVERGKVILCPPSADKRIISPSTWTLMKMAIAPDESACH